MPTQDPNLLDPNFGRRNYDLEMVELRHTISVLVATIEELKAKIIVNDKKTDELLAAWNTAKGLTAFVRWASSIAIACGILWAAVKGIPKL